MVKTKIWEPKTENWIRNQSWLFGSPNHQITIKIPYTTNVENLKKVWVCEQNK